MQVGPDPAAGVVCRRRHRDRLLRGVDANPVAGGHDGREPASQELPAQVAGVKVDVVGAVGAHHPVDRLGHDVPGRQLGQFMLAEHEPLPVPVDQVSTLAPQRLGDQGLDAGRRRRDRIGRHRQRRGMELDELHISHAGPGPQRRRQPVAGGYLRVGGGGEDLPQPAGGEYHRRRQNRPDPVLTALAHHVQRHSADLPVRTGQQVHHQGVLEQPDPRVAAYDRLQQPLHLGSGGIAAGVHHPVGPVSTLPGEHQRSVRVPVELGTEPDQLTQPLRPLGHQHLHRGRMAQAGTGRECVGHMRGQAVGRIEHGRYPALCPPGRPVVHIHLGDHGDVTTGLAQVQGGGETGDPGTHHHHIGGLDPPWVRCVQPGGEHRQIW